MNKKEKKNIIFGCIGLGLFIASNFVNIPVGVVGLFMASFEFGSFLANRAFGINEQ